MKSTAKLVNRLLKLTTLITSQPTEIIRIESAKKSILESLNKAFPQDIFNIFTELIDTGFSSTSKLMERDETGGIKWAPEKSQKYCECMFCLGDILFMSGSTQNIDISRRIIWRATNLSALTQFCIQLKIDKPFQDLLTFEGRNKAAQVIRPRMEALTKDILSLSQRAKKLNKQGLYEEAAQIRKQAARLNQLYPRIIKEVLPWLEKKHTPITKTDSNSSIPFTAT